MSFCSFRRIFNPTLEEQIHDLKQIILLHDGAIGECYTCEHYISSNSPGFVTDFGSCDLRNELFIKKLLEEPNIRLNIQCPDYKERSIEYLRGQLAKLEPQTSPKSNHNSFEQFILTRFQRKE